MRFILITIAFFACFYVIADQSDNANAATLSCNHPFAKTAININKIKCMRIAVNISNKTQALMRVRIWKRRAACNGNKGALSSDVFLKNNKWVARVIFYCTRPANKKAN